MEFHKLLFYFSCLILLSGVEMAKISMKNNCQYTVWPGTLTGGNTQLSKTGFELASQQTDSVDVPAPWTGRIFARTQCKDTNGKFTCATADCGPQVQCNGAGGAPPATLAEFTVAAPGGQDFYDVSLVDGFNLPLSITPEGGSGNNCTLASCGADVNKVCPANLQVNGDGGVVGCKSACVAFGEPRYCCTQEYNKPETCKPTNYSMIFKEQCPQAYSYAYDDLTSTFSCMGGPNYLVTFCP